MSNQQSNHHIPDSAIPSSSAKEIKLERIRIKNVQLLFIIYNAIMLDASYIIIFGNANRYYFIKFMN